MIEPGRLSLSAYLLLVSRSLVRHRRRTLLTVSGIAVGIAALTLLGALSDGWTRSMQENFILGLSGHLQVRANRDSGSSALNRYLTHPERVEQLLESRSEARAWTTRLRAEGLATTMENRAAVRVLAVEPDRERQVTHLHRQLSAGTWLVNDRKMPGVILGDALANALEVIVGDRVTLTAQSSPESLSAGVFRVQGVLDLGLPTEDATLAVISLADARNWLGRDSEVSEIVVRTTDIESADDLHRFLKRSLAGSGAEIADWRELDPAVHQWLLFAQVYSSVVLLIVVLLTVAEVLNTMLTAVHERRRELALMGALGVNARQLFQLLFLETLAVTAAGAVVGILAGVAMVLVTAGTGVDLTGFSGALQFFYMNTVVYPNLEAGTALRIVGAALAAGALAGIYPAWKGCRIDPAVASGRLSP